MIKSKPIIRNLVSAAAIIALSMSATLAAGVSSSRGSDDNGALAVAAVSLNQHQTVHKTIVVSGVEIFYREAGPADAPTLLLLHGFPTSSHMFRNLIPALADRYHLVHQCINSYK